MTTDRYDSLLAQLLDGELTPAESDEFAAALRADEAHRRELRQHLIIWELWTQQHAAERSADAFLAACRTRLTAERNSDRFVSELGQRLRAQGLLPAALTHGFGATRNIGRTFARWWSDHVWVGLASSAAAFAAISVLVWAMLPHAARATTTLHGEAICTSCMLHETHEHLPAIRVREEGVVHIYYVQPDPRPVQRLGGYCMAPMPIVVTGQASLRDGRRVIDVRAASSVLGSTQPPALSSDNRVLFPF
jgi:hypothetical protein